MTKLAEAIDALRSAVSGSKSADRTTVRAAVDADAFEDPEIVAVPGERALAHVSVRPAEPITVADLEKILGPGRRLPREPSGGRTVMFTDTLPGDGESGATVLAEVDEDGRVNRLIIRADTF
jgi:hypothetical protein